jgi:metal-responsive CopG/Arc/MetJ family transcriptional regulator
MKKKTKKLKSDSIRVFAPADLIERMDRVCANQDTTRSQLTRKALREYLKKLETDET